VRVAGLRQRTEPLSFEKKHVQALDKVAIRLRNARGVIFLELKTLPELFKGCCAAIVIRVANNTPDNPITAPTRPLITLAT